MIAADASAYVIVYAVMASLAIAGGSALPFALAGMAALVFCALERVYPGYRLYGYEQIRRRATAFFKAALLAAAVAFLLTNDWRQALVIAAFLAAGSILQLVTHRLARQICRSLGVWGERAVVIADPATADRVAAHFTRNWQYGIRPEPAELHGRAGTDIGERRVALIADAGSPTAEALASMRRDFIEVVLLADTPHLRLSGLQPADFSGEIGLRLASGEKRPTIGLARRGLDLAIAVPAALLASPIIAIAGAAIYAFDPGPIFYWQKREGLAGKPVRVLKLRTMYRDAEARLETLFNAEPSLREEWLAHFKLKQDPRILPVIGHILRSTSCDELPQLLNVIAGHMSLVGPRPFPEYHLLAMNAEFRHKRRSVVPGLTGLWQISERSNADIDLQRQLDEFYIDNRSIWLDLHIIISTIPAVFKRGGAY
ncbi:sugar transferase [Mesorhizobium sp. BR1-1-16]|uniref:sugar transferase n=1 Tax=Mesorhizobium sp. BR1-1-16 TaxID=2876653 RepID=UPI001CCD59F7|nr:sugar transferase [Mesorhizobium sp. BR1-1-16]MBZ9936049.1 sugar transferase [Mesorhizobium sp. BR1-1-16]